MFAYPERSGGIRWNLSLVASLGAHFVVLFVLCQRPVAIFVKASPVAHGDRGPSLVLYFAAKGDQENLVAKPSKPTAARLHFPTPKKTQFNARITNQKDTPPQNVDAVSSTVAGSPSSSDLWGSTTGPNVKPAIETTLLEPAISKSEIPRGVEGDVIVEISIDEHGNVIGTRLLKGLAPEIDEKCMATARNWRYRPATQDGVPIPSKNDHHWHFHG